MEDSNIASASQPDDLVIEKDKRIAELENNWKRAVADYKNLERRVSEEKEVFVRFSNLILLERLVPILDNLEALSSHLKDQGLSMVTKQLQDFIREEGMEEVGAQGRDFDPMTMEAVETVEGEENKVVEVLRKGYRLHGKLVRPTRVKVGKKVA